MKNRRDFLRGTALVGLGAMVARQAAAQAAEGRAVPGAAVMGHKTKPLPTVKIGVVGLGARGPGAVHRLVNIPGVEIAALCDLIPERAERQKKWIVEKEKPEPKCYSGTADIWKKMCESDEINLVYITTPWLLHTPMAVYAMKCGKHAVTEVPAAVTLDQCWELVETSEKTGMHCMMLENCCYGENEMLALMLCRAGALGELVHGEAAYIHDLRESLFNENGYHDMWRLKFGQEHTGNPYPTHGLGPVCQYMNINRGDKFEYLTSVSSNEFGLSQFAREKFGADSKQAGWAHKLGDMNSTLIKTAKGRTILVQHDTTSPRPYSRINTIAGTKGILTDYPLRIALAPKSHEWMKDEEVAALKAQHTHPLWQKSGDVAKKVGGHGGMDFLMDLRLCHCLQNGLPLDIDVYDSALWSCLVDLSERSVLKRGASIDVPDFTRGAWKTAAPLGIVSV